MDRTDTHPADSHGPGAPDDSHKAATEAEQEAHGAPLTTTAAAR
jgi:hypothetical protein